VLVFPHEVVVVPREVLVFPHEVVVVPREVVVVPREVLVFPREMVGTSCDVVLSPHGLACIRRHHRVGSRCLLPTACFVLRTSNEDVSRTSHVFTGTLEVLWRPRNEVLAACLILRT
jgi:hypothetical protein